MKLFNFEQESPLSLGIEDLLDSLHQVGRQRIIVRFGLVSNKPIQVILVPLLFIVWLRLLITIKLIELVLNLAQSQSWKVLLLILQPRHFQGGEGSQHVFLNNRPFMLLAQVFLAFQPCSLQVVVVVALPRRLAPNFPRNQRPVQHLHLLLLRNEVPQDFFLLFKPVRRFLKWILSILREKYCCINLEIRNSTIYLCNSRIVMPTYRKAQLNFIKETRQGSKAGFNVIPKYLVKIVTSERELLKF